MQQKAEAESRDIAMFEAARSREFARLLACSTASTSYIDSLMESVASTSSVTLRKAPGLLYYIGVYGERSEQEEIIQEMLDDTQADEVEHLEGVSVPRSTSQLTATAVMLHNDQSDYDGQIARRQRLERCGYAAAVEFDAGNDDSGSARHESQPSLVD